MENLTTNTGWVGAPKKLTIQERDGLLNAWLAAKQTLDAAKDEELKLRNQIVADMISPKPGEEGTRNYELNNGYKLKAVLKLSYKLDKEKVDQALDLIEKDGDAGKLIAERLVKFEPKLSVSEYKKLPDKYKPLIDKALTIEDATPSLELVAPKGK